VGLDGLRAGLSNGELRVFLGLEGIVGNEFAFETPNEELGRNVGPVCLDRVLDRSLIWAFTGKPVDLEGVNAKLRGKAEDPAEVPEDALEPTELRPSLSLILFFDCLLFPARAGVNFLGSWLIMAGSNKYGLALRSLKQTIESEIVPKAVPNLRPGQKDQGVTNILFAKRLFEIELALIFKHR
jgi:hypothetical protein